MHCMLPPNKTLQNRRIGLQISTKKQYSHNDYKTVQNAAFIPFESANVCRIVLTVLFCVRHVTYGPVLWFETNGLRTRPV